MAKAKKGKNGHVAIPFLLAFLLGIVGIGGIAMYIFNQLNQRGNHVQPMQSSLVKPTEEDNMTLLFVLDEPSDPCPVTFMLARILPGDKKIILVSLPSNMLALVDGRQEMLSSFYKTGGIQSAMAAISNETGIRPDRYIILDSDSFQKICNIYAGVYYQIPVGTQGFADSTEQQYLGPAQMEKLLTNPFFENGESERSAVASDLICEMINQTDYDRIVASMDSNFRTLINMMNTDISSIDYTNKKAALKFMYTYGSEICTFRLATGSTSEDNKFILSNDFHESISDYFDIQLTAITPDANIPDVVPEDPNPDAVPEDPNPDAVPEDPNPDAVPEDPNPDAAPEDEAAQ